jgi:erythronate-4-phosphate dehydrogenase
MSNNKPAIIIDSDIPFIQGVLEPFFCTKYIKSADINSQTIKSASALIIRTRTRCNQELLEGSSVNSIFTATIGNDHIDMKYCTESGIDVYNAAGCNANGVVQYVITSLFIVCRLLKRDIFKEKLGIIGAGNVGERLAATAARLGIEVMRCDPPLKVRLQEDPLFFSEEKLIERGVDTSFYPNRSGLSSSDYFSLNQVLNSCSVISFHVPLNEETTGMCSKEFMSSINQGAVLINSSRGEIFDEDEVIRGRSKLGALISDVWSAEPEINPKYLEVTNIATPHIAGYSLEGKINATVFTVRNIAKHFKIESLIDFLINYPDEVDSNTIIDSRHSKVEIIACMTEDRFPIMQQDKRLRDNPHNFENLRTEYKYRREFSDSFLKKLEKVANLK